MLAPDFTEYFQTGSFLDMLKSLDKAKTQMKLNSYQEVIDHFDFDCSHQLFFNPICIE